MNKRPGEDAISGPIREGPTKSLSGFKKLPTETLTNKPIVKSSDKDGKES